MYTDILNVEYCKIESLKINIKQKKEYSMKKVEYDEVKKELNWKQRIIIRLFPRTFYKVFHISRTMTLNYILQIFF